MNDCDIFNSLALTTCVVMGFLYGIDNLDWGHNPFLSPFVTFVRLSYRGIPLYFHLVMKFLVSRLSFVAFSIVILGHPPFFCHDCV